MREMIKEKIIPSVISALVTLMVVSIISTINSEDLIHLFGGATKKDIENIKGNFGVQVSNIVSKNDGRFVDDIAESTTGKYIDELIEIEKESVVIATASAKGKHTAVPGKSSYGTVISKLFIDDVECSKDNSGVNNVSTYASLDSSCTCIKKISPGQHKISAHGIYYGNVENPDISLQYVSLSGL